MPCGMFHLKEDSEKPIVFLSGGIGLAPLISMLDHAMSSGFNMIVTGKWYSPLKLGILDVNKPF